LYGTSIALGVSGKFDEGPSAEAASDKVIASASPVVSISPSPVPGPTVTVTVTVTSTVTVTATVTQTSGSNSGAAAAGTIEDGTYTVGVDISPGTYRPMANVSSMCYWAIYKSGTNGGTIIENDIPGGGRTTVTLSNGQDFHTMDCGTWAKQ
jgi:hypothetical protein